MSNRYVETFADLDGGTETTVVLWTDEEGASGVSVSVRCIGSRYVWTCPDATAMRRMVDKVLKGTDLKRSGPRWGYGSGWRWQYPITKK